MSEKTHLDILLDLLVKQVEAVDRDAHDYKVDMASFRNRVDNQLLYLTTATEGLGNQLVDAVQKVDNLSIKNESIEKSIVRLREKVDEIGTNLDIVRKSISSEKRAEAADAIAALNLRIAELVAKLSPQQGAQVTVTASPVTTAQVGATPAPGTHHVADIDAIHPETKWGLIVYILRRYPGILIILIILLFLIVALLVREPLLASMIHNLVSGLSTPTPTPSGG